MIYAFLLWFTISGVTTSAQGFNYTPQILIFYPIQLLLLLFVSKLIPTKISGPIDLLQIFTCAFLTIPMVVISFSNSSNINLFSSLTACFFSIMNQMLFFALAQSFPPRFKRNPPGGIKLDYTIYLLLFLSIILIALIFIGGNFHLNFSSLENLYDNRIKIENYLNSSSVIIPYCFGWLGGSLVPILFSFGLVTRNYLLLSVSGFGVLFVYAGASQKWIIASIFFLTFLFFVVVRKSEATLDAIHIFRSFIFLILALFLVQLFVPGSRALDLGVRRSLIDPAIMVQYYSKFATENSLGFWRESNISKLFFGIQSKPISEVIGDKYFFKPPLYFLERTSSMNATSGALGDSIAQGGIFGFLFVGMFVYLFFYILHFLGQNKNPIVVFMLSALAVEVIIEGTLHTQILSKGLILVPLVFLLLPIRNKSYLS